jgi:transposase
LPVLEMAWQAGVSRLLVWHWQRRFAEKGVDILLREPSRKPGKAPVVPQETVQRVVALTCSEPRGTATHTKSR